MIKPSGRYVVLTYIFRASASYSVSPKNHSDTFLLINLVLFKNMKDDLRIILVKLGFERFKDTAHISFQGKMMVAYFKRPLFLLLVRVFKWYL